MDWRRLVKTSRMRLLLSSVGAPVMEGKLAVASTKRSLAFSAVTRMLYG